jgi:hypothetical protein
MSTEELKDLIKGLRARQYFVTEQFNLDDDGDLDSRTGSLYQVIERRSQGRIYAAEVGADTTGIFQDGTRSPKSPDEPKAHIVHVFAYGTDFGSQKTRDVVRAVLKDVEAERETHRRNLRRVG